MKILELSDPIGSGGTSMFPRQRYLDVEPFGVLLILLLIWSFGPALLRLVDEHPGSIDQSIWLLVVLSLISFLMVTGLCWWLLKRFWVTSGLTPISDMVSQFNTLILWQQICFFLVSFGLLLLAATGAIIAIC